MQSRILTLRDILPQKLTQRYPPLPRLKHQQPLPIPPPLRQIPHHLIMLLKYSLPIQWKISIKELQKNVIKQFPQRIAVFGEERIDDAV